MLIIRTITILYMMDLYERVNCFGFGYEKDQLDFLNAFKDSTNL